MAEARSPYGGKKGTQGRKSKYTKEFLEDLSIDMLEYVKGKDNMYFMRQYFTHKKIRFDIVATFFPVSNVFKETYKICQQICADRLQMAAINNKINSLYVGKFIPFFDPDVSAAVRAHKRDLLEDQLETTKESGVLPETQKIILEINNR